MSCAHSTLTQQTTQTRYQTRATLLQQPAVRARAPLLLQPAVRARATLLQQPAPRARAREESERLWHARDTAPAGGCR